MMETFFDMYHDQKKELFLLRKGYTSVLRLGLPKKIAMALIRGGVYTVECIDSLSDKELLKVYGIGTDSLLKIRQVDVTNL